MDRKWKVSTLMVYGGESDVQMRDDMTGVKSLNNNNNDAVQAQLLAQQRSATAQSKAHRRTEAPFCLRFSCGHFGSEGRFFAQNRSCRTSARYKIRKKTFNFYR
jgi:hypothetical protein